MPDVIDPILFELLLILGIGILFSKIFSAVDTTSRKRELKRLEPRNWGAYTSLPEKKEVATTADDNV